MPFKYRDHRFPVGCLPCGGPAQDVKRLGYLSRAPARGAPYGIGAFPFLFDNDDMMLFQFGIDMALQGLDDGFQIIG